MFSTIPQVFHRHYVCEDDVSEGDYLRVIYDSEGDMYAYEDDTLDASQILWSTSLDTAEYI